LFNRNNEQQILNKELNNKIIKTNNEQQLLNNKFNDKIEKIINDFVILTNNVIKNKNDDDLNTEKVKNTMIKLNTSIIKNQTIVHDTIKSLHKDVTGKLKFVEDVLSDHKENITSLDKDLNIYYDNLKYSIMNCDVKLNNKVQLFLKCLIENNNKIDMEIYNDYSSDLIYYYETKNVNILEMKTYEIVCQFKENLKKYNENKECIKNIIKEKGNENKNKKSKFKQKLKTTQNNNNFSENKDINNDDKTKEQKITKNCNINKSVKNNIGDLDIYKQQFNEEKKFHENNENENYVNYFNFDRSSGDENEYYN